MIELNNSGAVHKVRCQIYGELRADESCKKCLSNPKTCSSKEIYMSLSIEFFSVFKLATCVSVKSVDLSAAYSFRRCRLICCWFTHAKIKIKTDSGITNRDLTVIWTGAALVVVLMSWRWSALLMSTLGVDIVCASGINPKREQMVLTLSLSIVIAVAIGRRLSLIHI